MQIEIANPLPGGMSRTSPDRADSFIRRGLARMFHGKLQFNEIIQADRQEEYYLARIRAGMVFWNADKHPLSMHRPGEVRS